MLLAATMVGNRLHHSSAYLITRQPRRFHSKVIAQSDAYGEGKRIVSDAASAQVGDAGKTRSNDGRQFVAVLQKPLGIVLAENPSGRGTFVAAFEPGSEATRKLEIGDYLVAVVNAKAAPKVREGNLWATRCSSSTLPEALAAIDDGPDPIALRMVRGGIEPWQLERDGSGLSVDEMVQAANRQYGRLIDPEQEEALRLAFATIKEEDQRRAAVKFESGSLQAAERLSLELRSFAVGAREALDRLGAAIINRALLESQIAVRAAEYVLRRAVFDTGRVLTAGAAAFRLSAAAEPDNR